MAHKHLILFAFTSTPTDGERDQVWIDAGVNFMGRSRKGPDGLRYFKSGINGIQYTAVEIRTAKQLKRYLEVYKDEAKVVILSFKNESKFLSEEEAFKKLGG